MLELKVIDMEGNRTKRPLHPVEFQHGGTSCDEVNVTTRLVWIPILVLTAMFKDDS